MVRFSPAGQFSGASTHVGRFPSADFPRPHSSLVAREKEITDIGDHLRRVDVRLVTLTGPGGIGKTRVAIEVARTIHLDTTTNVAFIPLAPLSEPERLAASIGLAFGIAAETGDDLLQVMPAALEGTSALLVLDNFEHLLEAAPLTVDLLNSCPTLKVVVTSRCALRVSGEIDYSVPPLDTADPLGTDESIVQSASYRLFVDRATTTSSSATDDPRQIALLCRQLDGLPLAIELAAARSRILSVSDMLERLGSPLPLLGNGPRDAPLRQRSMRDTIAWSYDILPEPEQRLFRVLSVFRGGFTLRAVEAVAPPGLANIALDLFSHLVEHNLVRRTPSEEVIRFSMHMAVREFSAELLTDCGEEPSARNRHAGWLCDELENVRPDSWVSLRSQTEPALPGEQDNLRAALGWCVAAGDASRAVQIARGLVPFWWMNGMHREAMQSLQLVLGMEADLEPEARIALLCQMSTNAFMASEHELAQSAARDALAISEEIGDSRRRQSCLETLGNATMDVEPATAMGFHDASIELGRANGDNYRLAVSLCCRCQCLMLTGEPLRALADAVEALTVLDSSPENTSIRATALALCAWTSGMLGRFEDTREYGSSALALSRETRTMGSLRMALRSLGELARHNNDFETSAAHFSEALELAFRDAVGLVSAALLIEFAMLSQASGDFLRAARLFGAADMAWIRHRFHPSATGFATWKFDQNPSLRALGSEAFAKEFDRGRAMTSADAYIDARSFVPPGPGSRKNPGKLTRREKQVLELVAQGMTNKEIASALFVGTPTIDTHVANAIAKLGARSRWTAVNEARRLGLLHA